MTESARIRSGLVGIAGTGRVAQALGRLLTEAGMPVVAIAGRDPDRAARAAHFLGARARPVTIEELPAAASHVLIAVSDAAVEPVAELLARSGFVDGIALHTCGARGPEALNALSSQGVSCGSLHPLQSFATPEKGLTCLTGSVMAIDGDPIALEWASSLVSLLRGRGIRIAREHRSLYHAAAAIASNYIPVLLYAATELLQAAGLENQAALDALAPLMRNSAENCFQIGPVKALTGPIERGDCTTVLAHLGELKHQSNALVGLYCSAGRVALEMARLRGLPEAKAADIEEALSKEMPRETTLI